MQSRIRRTKEKIKLVQDKVVKHSVRYALQTTEISMSVYVPKELILRMQMNLSTTVEMENGYPKTLWLDASLEEPK